MDVGNVEEKKTETWDDWQTTNEWANNSLDWVGSNTGGNKETYVVLSLGTIYLVNFGYPLYHHYVNFFLEMIPYPHPVLNFHL